MNARKILLIIGALAIFQSCQQSAKTSIPVATARPIDAEAGSGAFFTKDNNGNIVLSWVKERNDSSAILCYAVSADNGKTFGEPVVIPSSNKIHPHAENLPKIIFKSSGEVIAVWGELNPKPTNPYSGKICYAQSFDNGRSWSAAKNLVTDVKGDDQRYFDVALKSDGEAAIVWLDNRKTTTREGSAIYYASTKGRNGFEDERRIGEPCCECCRTDLLIDHQNIHIVYRAILDDSIRDMVHVFSGDGGKTFSSPERISEDNWVIRACPHTGPTQAINKSGLHAAWFTMGRNGGVYYSHSKDNGKSFSTPDSIAGKSGKHPQIAVMPNNELAIVWDEVVRDSTDFHSSIGFQLRSAEGINITRRLITPDFYNAVFPVVVPAGNDSVLVAYTRNDNNGNHVFFQLVSCKP